jgi:hypothetical protein
MPKTILTNFLSSKTMILSEKLVLVGVVDLLYTKNQQCSKYFV